MFHSIDIRASDKYFVLVDSFLTHISEIVYVYSCNN